jgi:hypothetical protein
MILYILIELLVHFLRIRGRFRLIGILVSIHIMILTTLEKKNIYLTLMSFDVMAFDHPSVLTVDLFLIILPAVLGSFLAALNKFIADRYSLNHSVSEYHVYEFFKIWNCSRERGLSYAIFSFLFGTYKSFIVNITTILHIKNQQLV